MSTIPRGERYEEYSWITLCNDRGVHGGEQEKATEMKAGAVGCLNAQALMLVTFKTPDGGADRRFQDEYTLVTADQVELKTDLL